MQLKEKKEKVENQIRKINNSKKLKNEFKNTKKNDS